MSDEKDSWFKEAFGVDLGQAFDKIKERASTEVSQAETKVAEVVQDVRGVVEAGLDSVTTTAAGVAKSIGSAVSPSPPANADRSRDGPGSFPLSGSVGRGGKNAPSDVRAVQAALGLESDGTCGRQTVAAIEAFQRKAGLAKPDGRVDAGGATEHGLARGVSGPATAPASPVEEHGTSDWQENLTRGAVGLSDQLAQGVIDGQAQLTGSLIDVMPMSDEAKDAARTGVQFEKGMQEGAYGAVKSLGESAMSALDLVSGATLGKYVRKGAAALESDEAAQDLRHEAAAGLDKAVGAAKLVGGLMITQVDDSTERALIEKAVKDYRAAAARGEGAEFVGKGIGYATVMAGGMLLGGAAAEGGAAADGATLLSEGSAEGGAMAGLTEEGAIGAAGDTLPPTLPESPPPTLSDPFAAVLDEPIPATEMPPTEMPPTQADPLRSPLAESVRAPRTDSVDPFGKTELDARPRARADDMDLARDQGKAQGSAAEAPKQGVENLQDAVAAHKEAEEAFFESTQKYLRYKQRGPGGVEEDLSNWDPTTEERLRDEMFRTRTESIEALQAEQKFARGARGRRVGAERPSTQLPPGHSPLAESVRAPQAKRISPLADSVRSPSADSVPPTEMPPTEMPPTEMPPTEMPTEMPPTEMPPTEMPPTANAPTKRTLTLRGLGPDPVPPESVQGPKTLPGLGPEPTEAAVAEEPASVPPTLRSAQ